MTRSNAFEGTAIDKNVNYFNQSFISAEVETRNLDCVVSENLAGFHPLLRDLRSVHFYGSKEKKITWYYEMCSADDCGNPFE
jgi:tRNA(Ile2) C34 agmatinyltransferase TiaS